MADLNKPKDETGSPRVNLPNQPDPSPEAKPPVANLPPVSTPVRPPPRLMASKPLPSPEKMPGPRPPASPPLRPPSPVPKAGSIVPPELSKANFPPTNRPLENRDMNQAGGRKETVSVADSTLKAAIKWGNARPAIRAVSPAVANPPARGLDALAPVQLCWALLSISTLTLIMQLWNYFS
jgi:hypothetical protein